MFNSQLVKSLHQNGGPMFAPVSHEIRGHEFNFMAGGGVFWVNTATLLLADLHFGKAEALQRRGVPLPHGSDRADLDKLRTLVEATSARRLILLGDIFHARPSGTEAIFAEWNAQPPLTTSSTPLEVLAIVGNHDRHGAANISTSVVRAATAQLHGLSWLPSYSEAGFSFHHEPSERLPGTYGFCGHIHPCLSLGTVADRARFPVFWIQPELCVLPAFGALTGGSAVSLGRADAAIILTPAGPRWAARARSADCS
ncbi:ligase-associated DNA damage response endonuclease PdeM [Allohahella marinimesophila]|uniref:ligase-associated DNA damage response endonuclease PdeM n=1 Tax=Allohahella marinimesophila TaxID=1054972 RepID=UPI0031E3B999